MSVYFLVWVGFSILRVKLHARLFECHWNSHNQSFFLYAFILLLAHNWFCVPLVLSHALHPPQLSNCGMGQLETHLQGLPRPKRNRTRSTPCYTAWWPTTEVSNLLSMRRKSMKKSSGYMVNMMYTSDLNITTDDTVSSVVPVLGQ
jgi:hypothetical protein